MNHGPQSVLDRLQGFIEKDTKKKSKRRRLQEGLALPVDGEGSFDETACDVEGTPSALEVIETVSVDMQPQTSNITADFFPISASEIDYPSTSLALKLRKIRIMQNVEVFGATNKVFSKPSHGASATDDSEKHAVKILPCRNLMELGEIYGTKVPRVWKNVASSPAFCFSNNYSRYLSSCLAAYGDVFLDNNIPPDSPVDTSTALTAPIMLHMLGHVVNMRTAQVKNNAKKKAALLVEETDAAMAAATDDSKKKDKKIKKQLKQDLAKARSSSTRDGLLDAMSLSAGASESGEDDSFHDAGFTRPRVLILCPFRHSVLSLVNNLIRLLNGEVATNADIEQNDLSGGSTIVSNYEKLLDEFSYLDEDEDEGGVGPSDKPVDWQRHFHGKNSDDDFKLGLQINPGQGRGLSSVDSEDAENETGRTKSKNRGIGLRLFSEFYSSDIIIASPIGLRFVLENSSNKGKRDGGKSSSKPSVASDFLSSLECIYLHQADVLHMQNWEHVEFVLKHSNQLPTLNSTQVDYSRVRPYFLNQQGKFHRQLIVSSAFNEPTMQATFRQYSTSCAGTLRVRVNSLENTVTHRYSQIKQDGYISQVVVPVNQIFQLIQCKSFADQEDARFEHFKEHILTPVIRSNQPHTLIIAPSYLHYVRIRNELLKREANAAFVCEYSRDSEISRGRSRFIHGQNSILLYSGRAHFFRRYKIRGALNLIFYSLPEYPHFYSEFINMLESSERIAAAVAARKHKEVFGSDADPQGPSNNYTATTDAMKKKAKKRLREQANERAQAALRQSSYTPEEIRGMDNSCVVLITEFDKLLLSPIVGAQRSENILSSGKSTFMFH